MATLASSSKELHVMYNTVAIACCAQSAEDSDAILAMCDNANVQFMDGSMWLHNPRTKALQAACQDRPVMGELVTVHSIFHNIFPGEHLADAQGKPPKALQSVYQFRRSTTRHWRPKPADFPDRQGP